MKIYSNSVSSFPYISGNIFLLLSDWHVTPPYPVKNLNNYIKPLNFNEVKENDIVFIKRGELEKFFINDLPKIKTKIKIITHNGDDPILNKHVRYINDNITEFWCVNNQTSHPKVKTLPIGLQNKNLYFDGNPQGDEKIINEIKNKKIDKTGDILLTFNVNTNLSHRKPIYDFFQNKPFITERKYSNIERKNSNFIKQYLEDIKKHKFVICPWGNGYDCHRNWEVLYMGSIPIIKKHPTLSYYESLPVWLVDDFSEVTKENLEKKYSEINNKKYDTNKLYFNYWGEKINDRLVTKK